MAHRLNIQNLREAAASLGDDSYYAIAKRTGLGETTVWRLMTGKCQPRAGTQGQLIKVYRLPIGQLMTDDDEESVAA